MKASRRGRTGFALLVAAGAVLVATPGRSAREVEITSKTGDVISEIARARSAVAISAASNSARMRPYAAAFSAGISPPG